MPQKTKTKMPAKKHNPKKKGLPGKTADISPTKAKQMLKEGTAKGKPLSEKQKGMFGAIAGQTKKKKK